MAFDIPYKPDTSLGYIEPENILMQTVWPIDYFAPEKIADVGDIIGEAFKVNEMADTDVGTQIESTLD